jgi:hypothetical protein
MPVTIKDHREEIKKSLNKLLEKSVYVGIPMSKNAREGEPITNAALGYIHEYGSPARNIPARPWLVPGVESARAKINERLKGIGRLALKGKQEEIAPQQNALGIDVVNAVQTYISDASHFKPLAPSTIAKRRPPGPYSPLIDTGALRRSITYVIRS